MQQRQKKKMEKIKQGRQQKQQGIFVPKAMQHRQVDGEDHAGKAVEAAARDTYVQSNAAAARERDDENHAQTSVSNDQVTTVESERRVQNATTAATRERKEDQSNTTAGVQEVNEEGRLTAAAANKKEDPASRKTDVDEENEEILALIKERRTIKKEDKDRIREVSKMSKNASETKWAKRQQKTARILEEMKGTKKTLPTSKQQKEESSFQR